MLVEPHVRRHDQRTGAPFIATGLLILRPHQAVPRAGEDDDMGSGAMAMGLLVCSHREFRDVAVHRPARHGKSGMTASGAAFARIEQRQAHGIGDEVGVKE